MSLQIANILVKRLILDPESSTNTLYLEAFKFMGIDESNIIRQSTILIGFNSEQKYTLGEIALPIYTSGVNLQTTFTILDNLSPYNVILGQPWIHEMRVIPSIYHQTIKHSTK